MSHVLTSNVQLLGSLVHIGEIDAASDRLLLLILLLLLSFSLFKLLDSENLDNTLGRSRLFFGLLFLCGAIEDVLDFLLGHESLLLLGHDFRLLLLNFFKLMHIESINFLGLHWRCVKLNLEARVRYASGNAKSFKMLLKFNEQLDMLASGEE